MTIELHRVDAAEEAVGRFLRAVTDEDGLAPLSEHKLLRLGGGEDTRMAAWEIDGELVAVSVAARHDGDVPHWALEVATGPAARTPAIERAALVAGGSTVPQDATASLWVQREAQATAATLLGYEERRRLLRMEGPLPSGAPPDGPALGTLDDTEDAALIEVHNRAFAGHPEASGMDQNRLDELRALPWFDPDGVITATVDGRLAGFCWTKLHGNGDGEIYFLGVDPDFAATGVGTRLAAAGYAHLGDRGADRAMLWVDAANERAVALYRRLGLTPAHANVEMVRPSA